MPHIAPLTAYWAAGACNVAPIVEQAGGGEHGVQILGERPCGVGLASYLAENIRTNFQPKSVRNQMRTGGLAQTMQCSSNACNVLL